MKEAVEQFIARHDTLGQSYAAGDINQIGQVADRQTK